MRIAVLGPLRVEGPGGQPVKMGSELERRLASVLALRPGSIVTSDALAEAVFGEDGPPDAHARLQRLLSRVRKRLGPGALVTEGRGDRLGSVWEVDAARFTAAVAAAPSAWDDPAQAAELLAEALGLWRGAPYTEVAEWPPAQAAAVSLEELRVAALEARVEADLALGRHAALCAELGTLVAQHPYREHLWGHWMLALYRAGRQAEALRAFEQLRRLLGDELGLEPADDVVALEEAIRVHKPELDWAPPAGTNEVAVAIELPAQGPLTVVFTDVVRSTELYTGRGDAAANDVLDAHAAIVRDVVRRHHGWEVKATGDGFMLAFASVRDALACAVAIQQAVAGHARDYPEAAVQVRIGINSGEVIRSQGDLFGQAVNAAARIAACAQPDEILVSRVVRDLARSEPDTTFAARGVFTLKGFPEPWPLHAVVWGDAAAAPPPPAPVHAARDLAFSTSFVGRGDELALVAALLTPPSTARVITVTGAGGIGKTRLARRAAERAAAAYPDGVYLAELAPLDGPDGVAGMVLAALGGRREANQSALAAVADFCRGAHLLVLLDNCEHVLAAAAECAQAIVAGRYCTVLATSREPLALTGERVVPLAPLAPDAALSLYADRARAVDPSFHPDADTEAAVAEICRRLDGVPLAIELAAARVRSMTAPEIARHLGDRFRLLRSATRGVEERHRTLHAAVQWSYDLLEVTERAVFAQLSTFAGGFTIAAVVAVCVDELTDELDAIDMVDALVARSFVVADRSGPTTRYSLLESLRAFGLEELANGGQLHRCRARHARHFLAVAEAGKDGPSAIFETEWDNIRSAIDWAVEAGDVDGALRLVVACSLYASVSLRLDVLPLFERAIAIDGAQEHHLWPNAAGATSGLRIQVGDLEGAEELALAAIAVEDERSLTPSFAPAFNLCAALWLGGQVERSEQALCRAESVIERRGDPLEVGVTKYQRVITQKVLHPDGLGTMAEDVTRDAETTGDPLRIFWGYAGIVAAYVERDKPVALEAYDKARHWANVVGSPALLGIPTSWLAAAASETEPLAALGLWRDDVVNALTRGWWRTAGYWVRFIIPPLVHFGRHRAAAILIGALPSLPGQERPDDFVPRYTAILATALGPDAERYFEEGRRLPRTELARLARAEIDAQIQPGSSEA